MKLPGGDRAIIPPGKLEFYCLNPVHGRGGDKARVFASALGITLANVGLLRTALRQAAADGEAQLLVSDAFGDQYRIDFKMEREGRSRTVRSGWIIRQPGGPPYLTTAFVLPSSHG
ncbi:DUF6883 domain-containing protein [Brevundimonas sp.]|uniref:DUF6883 domain-containing protein n=1 Tax=Brevundimonas sp. TaxID=1871086 RepID=UPI003F6E495B